MPTDRELQIIRLVEAGVALKRRPNSSERFGAVFDVSRIPQTVLPQTLTGMLRKQLLQFDKQLDRYVLTPAGREYIALRTRVRDFALHQDTE